MKQKLLFIAMLLSCVSSAYAGSTLSQENWRWRNDNGDETTATFKTTQNDEVTLSDHETVRLRIRVENTDGVDQDQHAVSHLSYSTTPADEDSFIEITEDASVNAFAYSESAHVADNDPTSNGTYLSTVNKNALSPYDYATGVYMTKTHDFNSRVFVLHSTYKDFEFAIKATSNAVANTTYYFKVDNADTRTGDDPTQTLLPHLTTAASLPVSFISFDLANEGKGVKLNWSTASEQNNDRFEISHSTDGINWINLTSVSGVGNSNVKNIYSAKDNNPANGANYYRLSQIDRNGTATVLGTKSINVTISSVSSYINIYPNPTVGDVNFVLSGLNKNQDVKATLVDITGKAVYQRTFTDAANGISYRLNVAKKPTPGIYILKVEGESLLLNKRVVFK